MDGAQQKIGRRDEIGVEYRDKFASGALESFLKSSGFIAFPVRPVQVLNRMPDVEVALAESLGERVRVVGGIVKYLYLEQFARVFDLHRLIDQPFQHIAFVVERQLDGDSGQFRESLRWAGRRFLSMFEIGVDRVETVHPVYRKDAQNAEIGDQDRPVEPRQLMNTSKGVIEHAARDPRECGYGQERGHWW